MRDSDKVLVMAEGRVVEYGKPILPCMEATLTIELSRLSRPTKHAAAERRL